MSKTTMNIDDVQRATSQATYLRERALRFAIYLQTDPQGELRRRSKLCVICFYSDPSFSGQGFTEWSCALCRQNQPAWPTTSHPRLCLACATNHDLCAGCGADIELHARKKILRKTSRKT